MIEFIVVHLDGKVRGYSAQGHDVTPGASDLPSLQRFAPEAQVIVIRPELPQVHYTMHDDAERYAK